MNDHHQPKKDHNQQQAIAKTVHFYLQRGIFGYGLLGHRWFSSISLGVFTMIVAMTGMGSAAQAEELLEALGGDVATDGVTDVTDLATDGVTDVATDVVTDVTDVTDLVADEVPISPSPNLSLSPSPPLPISPSPHLPLSPSPPLPISPSYLAV